MAMDCIAMDLVHHGLRTKSKCHDVVGKRKNVHGSPHFVVIKLSEACVLKYTAKILLLAFFLISLSWVGSMAGKASTIPKQGEASSFPASVVIEFQDVNPIKVEVLPLLFRDLTNEGLLRLQDRILLINDGKRNEESAVYDSLHNLQDNKMDVIVGSDSKRKTSVVDETYDFVFTHSFHANSEFIDRVLKVDGIVVVQLKGSSRVSDSFQKPSNYEIVYLRQFDSRFDTTMVAMRKMGVAMQKLGLVSDNNERTDSIPQRRLCSLSTEAKKAAALKKLENVLLEPPRAASGKSNTYSKKTRFLPDLMGDSLDSYPRRVFIDIAGDVGWFAKNYPTKNKDFEIYQVETTIAETDDDSEDDQGESKESSEIEISEWLRENVKEEEYVVMKAEAEVVEELVRNKAIGLVDELFMECNIKSTKNGKRISRRPYWECLALYGKLRDEGVAVHQWWG